MEAISTRAENVPRTSDFFGTLAIALRMPVDEDRLRTHLGSGAQRHGGVDSEFAGGIGGGGDYAALIALPADHHWLCL